jgi:hypothetical protein
MNNRHSLFLGLGLAVCTAISHAATITVTTADNANPGGQKSLLQALTEAQDGDTIAFNISGAGPHYLLTPANGYPYIRQNNLTIDGYTQPGSVPNTNTILAPNNAKIQIVLDSRNNGNTTMDYDPANGSTGYGDSEAAMLGVLDARGFTVKGLAFLGVLTPGQNANGDDISLYAVALANSQVDPTDLGAHLAGCWFGVDPKDGTTVAPTDYGITGFGNGILGTVVGVKPGVSDAEAKASFNVFCGQAIPIIIEGDQTRISGNFIGVLPDGLHDYDITMMPAVYANFGWEGNIELGDHNNAIIGTDGDGVNDANERNVIGGGLPDALLLPNGETTVGYDHNIEFYSGERTNIVVAGNYVGVGVDGVTRFTNGVPALNASSGSASRYRFGSDFDGVSDDVEANVVFNNWPASVMTVATLSANLPNDLNFFDELSETAGISYRGNKLVNNNPLPVAASKFGRVDLDDVEGAWLTNYYTQVLADVAKGLVPILATNSTDKVLMGTAPIPLTPDYKSTILDVYLADPQGIALGKEVAAAAGLTEFPQGFVQGLTYVNSFVVDGPLDLDPTPGAFKFDLTGTDVKGGKLVTAVANYSVSPAGTHNAVTISSPFAAPIDLLMTATPITIAAPTINGQNLVFTWSGGTPPYQVVTRSSLSTGLWSPLGGPTAQTSVTIPIGGSPQGYFQVQGQ